MHLIQRESPFFEYEKRSALRDRTLMMEGDRTIICDRLYKGMNIAGVTGFQAQKATLLALGTVGIGCSLKFKITLPS